MILLCIKTPDTLRLSYTVKKGYPSLLIYTFTIILDYRNGENNFKDPLLVYGCSSQGIKYRLFLGKY